MSLTVDDIIKVMKEYGIHPGFFGKDGRTWSRDDLRLNTGEIQPTETTYTTTLKHVIGHEGYEHGLDRHSPDWLNELEDRLAAQPAERQRLQDELAKTTSTDPSIQYCSWYSPMHFYGNESGIYIREACIRRRALDIALFINPSALRTRSSALRWQLERAAFYTFYLHEQFHHKVESFSLRLMVATGRDRYRPYKINVYHPRLGTSDCIEESLATAEAYLRLDEDRYKRSLDESVWDAVRAYLRSIIPTLPPGYREGAHYLNRPQFQVGLYALQSQVLDAAAPPSTPSSHWSVAPDMIRSTMDIDKRIYMIVPIGRPPMFPPKYASLSATSTTP